MKGLGILSNFDLVVAYETAVKLNLDRDFKEVLLVEFDQEESETISGRFARLG